jgi:DNA polymerase IV
VPGPPPHASILHVDLDAFFAAVEQRDDPALRGKPVVVGGSARRGVVASCSYEARRHGIHSAMPMAAALRLCPQVIVVRHRMERYADASEAFMKILGDFTPAVEPLSFDEAFLDVTGCLRLLGDMRTIATAIKRRVADELQLVASVGGAPIKLAAKIASDIDKPDGLRIVAPEQLLGFLHPLPTSRLWGVGEVTQGKLAALGLRTIGDVARYPERALVARLGDTWGPHLAALARGEDPRPVDTRDRPVSVGHRETFDHDHHDPRDLELVLLHQADRVGARLRRADLRAAAVVLYLTYDDFTQISRRTTLPDPTSDGAVIARAAIRLLGAVDIDDRKGRRVRLCGVAATDLEDRDAPRQLTLDEGRRARGERLGEVLDGIRHKFPTAAVKRAVHLADDDDGAD